MANSGLKFLSGGGEMGDRVRNYDWSSSPLGPAESWPASLKHAVSNVLRNGFPMLVLWGKKFTCFYNDAFIPSLGGEQHPCLGQPAVEIWSDGWDFVGKMLNTVMDSGQPVTFTDQPVLIRRNGATANAYFTFCYSALLDDFGNPGGVFVTCVETTAAQKQRVYETIISATPDLAYVFDLQYRFTYANTALLMMWGKSWDDAIGKGLRDNGYEEWHAAMHEREIDQVKATKQSVRGEVSFPHAVLGRRVYDYILVPVFNEQGEVEAVAGTTRDISDIKHTEARIRESEERFRMMAEGSPFCIAIADASGNAVYFNKAWVELTGRPMSALLEFGWADIIHPEDREGFVAIFLNAFQIRGPFTGEFRVLNATGNYRWLLADGVARFNVEGVFEGYISSCADITQQKENELELREKEAALANAIELAELGTWALDANNEFTFSSRYAEIFGFNKLKISHQEAVMTIIEADRVENRRKYDDAIAHGANGRYDAEYKITNASNGKLQIIHALGQATFDAGGKFLRMEGTAQDVTAQRELQLALENEVQLRTEELQATNEELATSNEELSESSNLLMRSNEELSQFAHVASHDLQEPVRKISVFVEMLGKALPSIDDRSKSYLDKIDVSANRMLNLIRDVLTHSQISSSASKFTQVDLNRVLASALSELEVVIQKGKCTIESDTLPVISAIEVQMGQLFSNLISNAIKFAKPGTPLRLTIWAEMLDPRKITTHFKFSDRRSYYQIFLKDNGIGFEQSHAFKIFEIFQRLHSKTDYAGTGIGLATCKKIVQNHGGEISASSSPGEGSVFSVILPVTH